MDLKELKNRLQNLNRRTTKSADTWKPKDEHDVRLVANPHSSDPLQEIHFHFEIGQHLRVYCPKMNKGKPCAICDFAELMRSWNQPNGKEKPEPERKADFEIFKKVQPKARIFTPVVERSKEEELAKWWDLSVNQAQQILEICSEGERLAAVGLEPTDTSSALNVVLSPDKAFDLHVSFQKPGEKGNTKSFTNVVIKGKITPSPLHKDKALVKKILESVKPLGEVVQEMSSAEVQKIFDEWIGSGTPEAKADGPGKMKYGEPKATAPSNSKEDAKKPGSRTLEDAFADMVSDEK